MLNQDVIKNELFDSACPQVSGPGRVAPADSKGIKTMPKSVKLFMSLLFCLAGLGYLMLLGSIWVDTEWKLANIIEAYGTFESMELVEHSFKYLFWFVGTFGIAVSLLLMSRYAERLKIIFAALVPVLIFTDIASAWLIRYHSFFATVLYASGFILAVCFLVMFVLVQYDLWFRKDQRVA